ncbi:MAG: riboflavin synthase [Bacteroidaceae bacterium]|nr:riboflavin synthase [Bacteroidaceae bacterium]
MFSGIIESMARVVAIEHDQDNVHLTLTCPFVEELSIDQSIAHNGVCLTVVAINHSATTESSVAAKDNGQCPKADGQSTYTVTAMRETLERSNLGLLRVGDEVNVERSMLMNGRLDGHIVQGHVDQTAVCIAVEDQQGSHQYTFKYESTKEMVKHGYFTVDKGSVTVNGVSLTVCRPTEDTFQVCIIPYTFDHTNFHAIKEGTVVNIEFDIIGKYIARMHELQN